MRGTNGRISEAQFLKQTSSSVAATLAGIGDHLGEIGSNGKLARVSARFAPGKMLRSRLGWALRAADPAALIDLARACAATEMIHTATLFHDDVIDGASLRRGQPSLWREVGETGAILLGDLFFSSAVRMLLESGDGELVARFVDRVKEVCAAEVCHEILFRGTRAGVETALRLARGKTGALFAFVAYAAGAGAPAAKRDALEEAGYLVGTAYQLADDLLDEEGSEEQIGKTLGTDRKRRKFTLAQTGGDGRELIREEIAKQRLAALEVLAPWPEQASRLEAYIVANLLPQRELQAAG